MAILEFLDSFQRRKAVSVAYVVGAALVAAAVAAVAAGSVGSSGLGRILAFFWPLLASTVFLLAAVTLLLRISPPPCAEDEAPVPGEDLIEFVAGEHLHYHHHQVDAAASTCADTGKHGKQLMEGAEQDMETSSSSSSPLAFLSSSVVELDR